MRRVICLMLAVVLLWTCGVALAATAKQNDKGNWEIPYALYTEVFEPFPDFKDVTKDKETAARFAALLIRDATAGMPASVFDASKITSVYISEETIPTLVVYMPGKYWWLIPMYSFIAGYTGDNNMTPEDLNSFMIEQGMCESVYKVDQKLLDEAMTWKVPTLAETFAEGGYEAIFRQADSVGDNVRGWMCFEKAPYAGFINRDGKILADNWNYAISFSKEDGKAIVYRGEMTTGKYSYPKSDDQHNTLGQYGMIDENGRVVLDLIYEDIDALDSEGMYQIHQFDGSYRLFNAIEERFIDIGTYDYMGWKCSDGWIQVFNGTLNEYGSPDKGVYGFIDKEGREVMPLEYEDLGSTWTNGLTTVEKGGKAGLINREGKIVVPCTWDDIELYEEGSVAIAKRNDLSYAIDITNGSILYAFNTKYAYKTGEYYKYYNDSNDEGLLDSSFQPVLPREYYSITWVRDSLFIVGKKNANDKTEYGVLNLDTNEMIVPMVYDSISAKTYEGLRTFKQLDYYGYMDEDFQVVIPAAFEDSNDFREGIAAVKENGTWKIIDPQGNTVY